MMGTEIFNFDASLAEKLTKTRVSFLTAPTVLRTCLDGTIGGSFEMLDSGQRPHVLGPRAGIMEPGLNMDSFIGPDCLLPVFWCSACITCHN